jgi:hypothetical protein
VQEGQGTQVNGYPKDMNMKKDCLWENQKMKSSSEDSLQINGLYDSEKLRGKK